MTWLGEPWPYWLLYGLAVALVVLVPVAVWSERRADERDRALWARPYDWARDGET